MARAALVLGAVDMKLYRQVVAVATVRLEGVGVPIYLIPKRVEGRLQAPALLSKARGGWQNRQEGCRSQEESPGMVARQMFAGDCSADGCVDETVAVGLKAKQLEGVGDKLSLGYQR